MDKYIESNIQSAKSLFNYILKTYSNEVLKKLDLEINRDLIKKLNHFRNILIAVVKNQVNLISCVNDHSFELVNFSVISIETLTVNNSYELLDSDLHLHKENDFYIDFTSDTSLINEKNIKMVSKFGNTAYISIYNSFYDFTPEDLISSIVDVRPSFRLPFWYSNLADDRKHDIDEKLEAYYQRVKVKLAYKSTTVVNIERKLDENQMKLCKAKCHSNNIDLFMHMLPLVHDHMPDVYGIIKKLIVKYKLAKKNKLIRIEPASENNSLSHPLAAKLNCVSIDDRKIYRLDNMSVEYIWPQHEYGFNPELETTYFARLKNENFRMIIGRDLFTQNLMELLCRKKGILDHSKVYTETRTSYSDSDVSYILSSSLNEIIHESSPVTKNNSKEIIWNKIETIAKLVSNSEVYDRTVSKFVSIIKIFSKSRIMAKISHYYEIAKTVAASFKASPKNYEYFYGKNGPYASYTLVKRASTQDSFKTTHYIVFYINDRNEARTSEWYTFNKNSLSWALKLPYVVYSVLQYYLECVRFQLKHNLENAFKTMTNLVLLCTVNNNPFSEVSENIRYLTMASLGHSTDFKGLIEKFSKFTPRSLTEISYLVKALITSAALNLVKENHDLKSLNIDGEMNIIMPQDNFLVNSFSYVISSFYVCNLFNKKRAFHEYSEAVNYLNLLEEESIYNKCKLMIYDSLTSINLNDFETEIEAEYNTLDEYLANDQVRFMAKPIFLLATAVHFRKKLGILIKTKKLYSSTLMSGCTMRGATKGNLAVKERQGIRAASSIFEGIMDYHDVHEKIKTGNPIVIREASMTNSSVDVWTLCKIQSLDREKRKYLYRIVQKDQKGHREISVLNFNMRVGTYAVEECSRLLNSYFEENVLEQNKKDEIVYSAIKRFAFEHKEDELEEKRKFVFYDNNDQKRWGPNHLMEYFAIISSGLFPTEISNLLLTVFINMRFKVAKFPESLIDLFINKKSTFRPNTAMGKIENVIRDSVMKGHFGMNFEWGMCQGILHNFSSVYHALKLKFESEICDLIKIPIMSFCTSDDGFRIIKCSSLNECLSYIERTTLVDKLFNIIRNKSKSFVQSVIAEFNSIFYHAKNMSIPVLKFRASTIDCGEGEDSYEDMIQAISSGTQHFLKGGSYIGSLIVSILCLTIYSEQWRKFFLINQLGDKIKELPCELGGLPLLEPMSILLNGPLTACYLRSMSAFNCSINSFSNLIAMSLDNPPEWLPTYSHRMNEALDGYEVLISASLNGLYSIARTRKQHSQFAVRHRFKDWYGHEKLANLRTNSTSIGDFIFNFSKLYNANTIRKSMGENSYYIRFTEPWLSLDRKVIRIANYSMFNLIFKKTALFKSQSEIDSEIIELCNNSSKLNLIKAYYEDLNYEPYSQNATIIKSILMSTEELVAEVQSKRFYECLNKKLPKFRPLSLKLIHYESEDPNLLKAELLKNFLTNDSIKKMIEPRFAALVYSNLEKDKIDLDKAAHLVDHIANNFFKYIRISTKAVTCSPFHDNDLSSFVTNILKYKFTESSGLEIGKIKIAEHLRHARVKISEFNQVLEYAMEKSIRENKVDEMPNDVHSYLVNVLGVKYDSDYYIVSIDNLGRLTEIAKILSSFDCKVKVSNAVLQYITDPYQYMSYPVCYSSDEFWSKATNKYLNLVNGIHMIKYNNKKETYSHFIVVEKDSSVQNISSESWVKPLFEKVKACASMKRLTKHSGTIKNDYFLIKVIDPPMLTHDVKFRVSTENNFMFVLFDELKIPLFSLGSIKEIPESKASHEKVPLANYKALIDLMVQLEARPEAKSLLIERARLKLKFTDEDLKILRIPKSTMKLIDINVIKELLHFIMIRNYARKEDVNILAGPYILNNNFNIPLNRLFPYYVMNEPHCEFEIEEDSNEPVEIKEEKTFKLEFEEGDIFAELFSDLAKDVTKYEDSGDDLDDDLNDELIKIITEDDEEEPPEIKLNLRFKVMQYPNIRRARSFISEINNLISKENLTSKNVRELSDFMIFTKFHELKNLSQKHFGKDIPLSLILFLSDFTSRY